MEALQNMFRGKNNPKQNTKLNEQDGFSTSGPILFYLDGLKEGLGKGPKRFIGPEEIQFSILGEQSMTLLLDLDTMTPIPHFAEIDYLDENRPLVILQPSKSLVHNRRYVVALVDATDVEGNILPQSNYLEMILRFDESLSSRERERGKLYTEVVIPFLHEMYKDLKSVQMIFDFHTTSADSQLAITKNVIQGTLDQFEGQDDHYWDESNVHVIKEINNDCAKDGVVLAKIIHASIDVPHFLKDTNKRATNLDVEAVLQGVPKKETYNVKFMVAIPCSIALGSKPVQAIIDYGHGFLYSRAELLRLQYFHK